MLSVGPGLPQPASCPECPPVWKAPCRALDPPSCPGLPWPTLSLVSTICAHGGPPCLGKPGVAFLGTAQKRVRACRRDSVSRACSAGGLLT